MDCWYRRMSRTETIPGRYRFFLTALLLAAFTANGLRAPNTTRAGNCLTRAITVVLNLKSHVVLSVCAYLSRFTHIYAGLSGANTFMTYWENLDGRLHHCVVKPHFRLELRLRAPWTFYEFCAHWHFVRNRYPVHFHPPHQMSFLRSLLQYN